MVYPCYSQDDVSTCNENKMQALKEMPQEQDKDQNCDRYYFPDDIDPPSLFCTEDSDSASSITSQDSSDSLCTTVTWASEIVQDVRYRPKTSSTDKNQLYYNSTDFSRFRQTYKEQLIKIAVEKRRQDRDEKRRQEQSSLETPLSWVVNKVHNYFSISTASGPTSSSTASTISRKKLGKEMHLEMLVDTLYLF